MKYKVKAKDCRLIVKAKACFGEVCDEKALDAFSRMPFRGFLRPKQLKTRLIEYTGPIGISLYDRLTMPISKRDFLFIIEQIVIAIQKIAENSLKKEFVVWNTDFVFMNETTKEIQFLYVPSTKTTEQGSLLQFLDSIIYSAIPAAEADAEFISRFVYYLRSQQGFNAEKIEKYIEKEDKSIVNTLKRQHTKQSSFITNKQQHYYEHYNCRNNDSDDMPTGLLDETEQTGLLDEEETTCLLDEDFADETDLLCDEDEGTALLNEECDVQFPTIHRVLTEEVVQINKAVFRMGKERSYADYVVADNNAVSRKHADIITRGAEYFIVDLNSKNHTYVNDQVLTAHCETALCDGDRIRLGNEEFIFNV